MSHDDYVTPAPPPCDVLLMSLHMARRLLITQIADAKSAGTSTITLERHLGDNREATRHVLLQLNRPRAA